MNTISNQSEMALMTEQPMQRAYNADLDAIQEIPTAPRLKAQQSPVDHNPLCLPSSKEFHNYM